MRITNSVWLALLAACSLSACGGASTQEPPDTGSAADSETTEGQPPQTPATDTEDDTSSEAQEDTDTPSDDPDTTPTQRFCEERLPGFDESAPGLALQFDMGQAAIFGEAIGFGAGTFMTAAREDYCKDPFEGAIPLDTCLVDSYGVHVSPQCETKDDCAKEQVCELQTDQDGQAIPDSQRCVTPREPLDVGPMVIEGFAPDPLEFLPNEAQHGAYMASSDGSLSADGFGYDALYVLHGEGNKDLGLGAFEVELYMPPALELSAPLAEPSNLGGIPVSKIDPEADLFIEWPAGDTAQDVQIVLTGTNAAFQSHSVVCQVADDGAFTIPATLVAQAGLGPSWFLNLLEVRRTVTGEGTAEGLSLAQVSAIQSVLRNVQRQKATADTDNASNE